MDGKYLSGGQDNTMKIKMLSESFVIRNIKVGSWGRRHDSDYRMSLNIISDDTKSIYI